MIYNNSQEITDNAEAIKDARGNTDLFLSQVQPYMAESAFNARLTTPGYGCWPGFTQTDKQHLEGYTQSFASIKGYIETYNGIIGSRSINVIRDGSLSSKIGEYAVRSYVRLDQVSGSRFVFTFAGEFPEEGGGSGISTPELDFAVGGIWNPRMFEDQNFSIEYALRGGFLPKRRPSAYARPYDMSSKGDQLSNRRATLHIVGLDGTRWMSTTDFMLESVSRGQQLKFTKISSFDGHTLAFDCNTNEVYNFTGKLLDAKGFDQARTWSFNWDRYIDPNVLAKNKSRVMLIYKDKIVVGYIIGFQSASSAAARFIDTLSFSMYVSDFIISDNIKNKDQVTTESNGNYYEDKDAWNA